MQTIIEVWNGNNAPCETCGAHDADANRLLCVMELKREILREGLTAIQADILQKYIESSEEYLLRMMELAFRDGFCTGGKMVMEMIR